MDKTLVKIIFSAVLIAVLSEQGLTDSELSESFNPGSYRTVFIIGKCKPDANLISEQLINNPIKSVLDSTLSAFFKFNNIGYISITCVHLIVMADTNQINYKIFGGGIGRDFINLSVVGTNANVMMSRAIVYGI